MTASPPLKQPLRRRIGRLMVTVSAEGVTLRGYFQRHSKFVTWAQIASLSDGSDRSLLVQTEEEAGREKLTRMHADPQGSVKKTEMAKQ